MRFLDDAELWRRAAVGTADAFGILFDRHVNAVYAYCFRRTADWALAEDLTSVVFLEAWRRRREIQLQGASALPWLLGAATNVIRNQQRSLRRYRAALERLPKLEPHRDFAEDLVERIDDEARMRAVLAALKDIPLDEQEAVALCLWQGLTSTEAAIALGAPAATVRTRLSRARTRLRALGVPDAQEVTVR